MAHLYIKQGVVSRELTLNVEYLPSREPDVIPEVHRVWLGMADITASLSQEQLRDIAKELP